MKVTLREKKIKDGKRSLYLDFYPAVLQPGTGKATRREFLKLYVYERPKTEVERSHNKETRLLAQNIAARRQLEIQAGNYGFLAKSKKGDDFLKYFRAVTEKHNSSKSAKQTWENAYLHFFDFAGGRCTFERLNQKLVEDFKSYLLTCHTRRSSKQTLKPSSAASYFQCFCAALSEAVKAKHLTENPAENVKAIKTTESAREYLTIEELQLLAKTECRMPIVLRRAALFSALTGMRFSDISRLRWENVRETGGTKHFVEFKIQKTGENLTLPISAEAFELLGSRGAPSDQIFLDLEYGAMTSVFIARWTLAAGITKTITFHSFRHTFATAQLTLGTDLYTVSKMLGHKSIQKTQIYARIVDEKKREAADKITLK
ncbi:MAG TPA: site-specific integrase [Pyrinomonadaceae bacterium]|jgi:integrase